MATAVAAMSTASAPMSKCLGCDKEIDDALAECYECQYAQKEGFRG